MEWLGKLGKIIRHKYRIFKHEMWKMGDPVKYCPVYTEDFCSHVDGPLCNYPFCSVMRNYKLKKVKN